MQLRTLDSLQVHSTHRYESKYQRAKYWLKTVVMLQAVQDAVPVAELSAGQESCINYSYPPTVVGSSFTKVHGDISRLKSFQYTSHSKPLHPTQFWEIGLTPNNCPT